MRFRPVLARFAVFLLLIGTAAYGRDAFAQSDLTEAAIAITYPLEGLCVVKFRGTTLLPRLKGEAKVKRGGRRGTRRRASIDSLPRRMSWWDLHHLHPVAISPSGSVDNLGEIKTRWQARLSLSKLDVTTPLQTFALIVTAEPHSHEGPQPDGGAGKHRAATARQEPRLKRSTSSTSETQATTSETHACLRSRRRFQEIPISLLGARQAVNLARFAGAQQDAPQETSGG